MNSAKVLFVWSRMGDYHWARIIELTQSHPDIEVYTADLGGSDALYKWQSKDSKNHTVLSNQPVEQLDLKRILRLIRLVRQNKIRTVFFAGYGKKELLLSALLLRLISKTHLIVFFESWYASSSTWSNKMKGKFLGFTYHSFFASGFRAKEHLMRTFDIEDQRIKVGYSVIDNEHFKRPPNVKYALENKTLLCVARFAPEKNIETLVKCFRDSKLFRSGWTLNLVGGGELFDYLNKNYASQQINFSQWVSYPELPNIFHLSTAFILGSTFEPWGLVVNEAMAAGLPVLMSKDVGCEPDLTIDQKLNFDPKNPDEIINAMNYLENMEVTQMNELSEASIKRIKKFDLNSWSNTVAQWINP